MLVELLKTTVTEMQLKVQ